MWPFASRSTSLSKTPMPFWEVSVGANENWTVWPNGNLPLAFPKTTFSRLLRSMLGESAYSRFALQRIGSLVVQPGRAPTASQRKGNSELGEILVEFDQALTAWRDATMDRFVHLPTFLFFGDDAVKALRASARYMTLSARADLDWMEVSVGNHAKGTLVLEKGRFDGEREPTACIANRQVKFALGTLPTLEVNTSDSSFAMGAREFSPLSPTDVADLAARRPIAEFVLMLIANFIAEFGFRQDADWKQLTNQFLPAHLAYAEARESEPIPPIQTGGKLSLEEQVSAVVEWAYHAGVLCRLLLWLDGAFADGQGGR